MHAPRMWAAQVVGEQSPPSFVKLSSPRRRQTAPSRSVCPLVMRIIKTEPFALAPHCEDQRLVPATPSRACFPGCCLPTVAIAIVPLPRSRTPSSPSFGCSRLCCLCLHSPRPWERAEDPLPISVGCEDLHHRASSLRVSLRLLHSSNSYDELELSSSPPPRACAQRFEAQRRRDLSISSIQMWSRSQLSRCQWINDDRVSGGQ